MKKTIKLTSVLLVLSMFLSNIAYADELIESEGIANKISSAMTYGVDKVKNTVLNAIPYEVQTDNESNNKKLQFHDPGMDLTSKDIKTLYDMGYSMVDISNAITLSAVSDETPYEILQQKGLKTADSMISLMSDDNEAHEKGTNEKSWQEVKEGLDLSEDVEVEENSEIIYDGEPDDIETIFRQLGINEILKENKFQESEINEAIENGVVEATDIDDEVMKNN